MGPPPSRPSRTGPRSTLDHHALFAPHRHGRRWYLCDRSYSNGRRLHLIRERCGLHRPTLYSPELWSGLVEQLLPSLPPASFDLVYLDPPYGTTAGDWDRAPDWTWLGSTVARLLKPTGQVVLHGQGMMAARAAVGFEQSLAHRFEVVWVKAEVPDEPLRTAILNGPNPLHAHEIIHVFRRPEARVNDLTYNPGAMHHRGTPRGAYSRPGSVPQWGWKRGPEEGTDTGWRYPSDVVFSRPTRSGQLYAQKPLDLVRYLILLLTRPGDRVLDPYTGTGTSLLAAYGLGRRSMGIEASPKSWGILQANLRRVLRDGPRPQDGRIQRRVPPPSGNGARSSRTELESPNSSFCPFQRENSSQSVGGLRYRGLPRQSPPGIPTSVLGPPVAETLPSDSVDSPRVLNESDGND